MDHTIAVLFGVLTYASAFLAPAVLVLVHLMFAWPILRGDHSVTHPRRAVALVLAVTCLLSALPMLPSVWTLEPFGMVALVVFAGPAIVTLVRLRRISGG